MRPLLPTLWNTIHTAIGSIPFIGRGISELLKGKLNVEVLDASAVGISLLMRDFGTAGLVILLLGLGDMLEKATKKKSLDSLAEQLTVRVNTVWVREPDGSVRQKSIQLLNDDEFIVARSGAAIPVDGTVVSGEAFVNQSTMTGEPLPVRKAKGMPVFAGTVVEEGEVDIRPTGSVENSRLNQIARFIDESEPESKAGWIIWLTRLCRSTSSLPALCSSSRGISPAPHPCSSLTTAACSGSPRRSAFSLP